MIVKLDLPGFVELVVIQNGYLKVKLTVDGVAVTMPVTDTQLAVFAAEIKAAVNEFRALKGGTMNVESWVRGELTGFRLEQKVVNEVLKQVKKNNPQFKDIWADRQNEHTRATLDSVWHAVRQEALVWIERHAPDHFSRSLLEAA